MGVTSLNIYKICFYCMSKLRTTKIYWNVGADHLLFCHAKLFQKIKRGLELVFSIWKSLGVLQRAFIKIMASDIYPYLFLYIHSPILLENKKLLWSVFHSKLDHRQWHILQEYSRIYVQWHILQEYSSVKIAFNMINKCHPLPIVHNILS